LQFVYNVYSLQIVEYVIISRSALKMKGLYQKRIIDYV